MKALQFTTYGAPEVLAVTDLPDPEPRPGEALVRVAAAGINPGDVKNVAGHFGARLPSVPGRDYAGVVVGGDGEHGMEVWGSGPRRPGAHAGLVVVPVEWIARKPARLSMEQAAAVGVPYVTAWCAIVRAGKIQSGETVVIVGVSGSVGRAATQIAQWKGARVIGASTRSENPSNADAMINTTTHVLDEEVRMLTGGKGADMVLDAVGGPMFEPALRSLRQGGRQMVISSSPARVSLDLVEFFENESRLIGVDTGKLTGKEVAELMDLLGEGFLDGHLIPPEIVSWPFERAVDAYDAVARGGTHAKQVLVMPS